MERREKRTYVIAKPSQEAGKEESNRPEEGFPRPNTVLDCLNEPTTLLKFGLIINGLPTQVRFVGEKQASKKERKESEAFLTCFICDEREAIHSILPYGEGKTCEVNIQFHS